MSCPAEGFTGPTAAEPRAVIYIYNPPAPGAPYSLTLAKRSGYNQRITILDPDGQWIGGATFDGFEVNSAKTLHAPNNKLDFWQIIVLHKPGNEPDQPQNWKKNTSIVFGWVKVDEHRVDVHPYKVGPNVNMVTLASEDEGDGSYNDAVVSIEWVTGN